MEEVSAPRESTGGEGEDNAAGGRRRRRRGGRRRTRSASGAAPQSAERAAPDGAASASEEPADEEAAESAAPAERDGAERRRRKRGTRGGRRRRKTEKTSSAVEVETIPGEEDDLPELGELPDDAVLVSSGSATTRTPAKPAKDKEPRRSKRGRKRSRSLAERDEDEETEDVPAAPPRHQVILVNAADPEETRAVVVQGGRIVDLQMTVKKHVSYVSDIYRGRVVNIESAIGAAFVDFGQGRNGFLHASDVLPCYGEADWNLEKLLSTQLEADEWDATSQPDVGAEMAESAVPGARNGAEIDEVDEEKGDRRRGKDRAGKGRPRRPRLPIDKLLKKGQLVAVQITKDAIGDKGPTLTTYISIPGRYLVLMPSLERTGVSRKIEDEKERRRLKRILSSLDIPDGMGVIVRTAGVGKTKAEIKRDLDYLLLAWEEFAKRLKSGRNPAPLYQESDIAIRTMRDLFGAHTDRVVVDEDEVHKRMVDFTTRLMPEYLDRVKRHEGPRPLLHAYGVEQDFEKLFARRVELPSGGSIVIEQTEALVAIDVNSGRTREAGAEFEDIALKTNLEAAQEIARQIRLRDLGGIIVLDYIDMLRASGRRAVERATRDALASDRARSKLGRISQFGLLELTRQRLGPGLSKLLYETCVRCRGSGRQRSASSRAQAILRRLGTAMALKGFTTVEVRAHPEVIEYLEANLAGELSTLEEASGRTLDLLAVPDQIEDSVLHYLRADGREVRPGGRRKR